MDRLRISLPHVEPDPTFIDGLARVAEASGAAQTPRRRPKRNLFLGLATTVGAVAFLGVVIQGQEQDNLFGAESEAPQLSTAPNNSFQKDSGFGSRYDTGGGSVTDDAQAPVEGEAQENLSYAAPEEEQRSCRPYFLAPVLFMYCEGTRDD